MVLLGKIMSDTLQGCICLIKNTTKTIILSNIITIQNNNFLFEYIFKCNLSWIFSIIIPVFSVISDYYQCWKQFSSVQFSTVYILIYLLKPLCFIWPRFFDEKKVKKNSIYLTLKSFEISLLSLLVNWMHIKTNIIGLIKWLHAVLSILS